jgi:hypothetical protein
MKPRPPLDGGAVAPAPQGSGPRRWPRRGLPGAMQAVLAPTAVIPACARPRPRTRGRCRRSGRGPARRAAPRRAAPDERIGHDIDHVGGLGLAGDPADRQAALVGERVDHVRHPALAAIMGAILDEAVGPDVVRTLARRGAGRTTRPPARAARAWAAALRVPSTRRAARSARPACRPRPSPPRWSAAGSSATLRGSRSGCTGGPAR